MGPNDSEVPKMSGALPRDNASRSAKISGADSVGDHHEPHAVVAGPSTQIHPRERQRRHSMLVTSSAAHEVAGLPTIGRPEDIHGYKGTFDPDARILLQPIRRSTAPKAAKTPTKRSNKTAQEPPQDAVLRHEASLLPGVEPEIPEANDPLPESTTESLFTIGDLSDEEGVNEGERKSSLDMLTGYWSPPSPQVKEQEPKQTQDDKQKQKQKEVWHQQQQSPKRRAGHGETATEEIENRKDARDMSDTWDFWGAAKKPTQVARAAKRMGAQRALLLSRRKRPRPEPHEVHEPHELQQEQKQQEQQEQQEQHESEPELETQRQETQRQEIPIELQDESYQPVLDRASMALTHIRNGKIHADSRHDNIKITYVDYTQSSSPEFFDIEGTDNDFTLRPLSIIPADLRRRLIIVEDLSRNTIHYLGRLFGVCPEFFEEHLTNSGYTGAFYNDPPASSWKTSGMKKSYMSMKWYRPALRLNVFPFSNKDLEDLLDPSLPVVVNPWSESTNLRVFKTETNIFRSEWELWTDPETTTRKERACAWEERASIWSKRFLDRGYQIVILLLDPLPTLVEQEEQAVVVTTLPQYGPTDSDSGKDEERRGRGGRSSVSTESDMERIDNLEDAEAMHNAGLLMKRYAAQKSIWHRRILRYIILNRKQRELLLKIENLHEVVEAKAFNPVKTHTLIEQNALRSPLKHPYDEFFRLEDCMEELRDQLNETKSTKSDFRRWLENSKHNAEHGNLLGVVAPLFQIVRRDSVELLRILDQALDNINKEILDDLKMEDRLSLWRKLIARAELEIPGLQRSITKFLAFLEILDPSVFTTKSAAASAIAPGTMEGDDDLIELRDLSKEMDNMVQRLDGASRSLMQNMALLESQRSIAEAHAVTKLTELAFFFIPLTFAATLFGMQIDLFENRAPVSIFLAVASSFMVSAYLVRLVIRSLWLRDLMGTFNKSIRKYADENRLLIRRGSIPTGIFVQWAWRELSKMFQKLLVAIWEWLSTTLVKAVSSFWKVTGFVIKLTLLISLFSAAPIAVLWTRKMNHGVQAMITLIILVPIIGAVGVPYYRATERSVRSALPQYILRGFRHYVLQSPWLPMLLVCVFFLSIAVVPLAIIWNRPVAPGIKAAVTVVIILIIFLGGVFYGIYRLISAARAIDDSSDDEDDNSMFLADN